MIMHSIACEQCGKVEVYEDTETPDEWPENWIIVDCEFGQLTFCSWPCLSNFALQIRTGVHDEV
jgi:hypothetical protein